MIPVIERGRGVSAGSLALALILVSTPLQAQSWRTLDVSRMRSGESALDVRVRYGAGRLALRPATHGILYRMSLRYDENNFEPVNEFDGRRLELGIDSRGRSIHVGDDRSGQLDVELARDVPMSLNLEFGAVRAELDLGGLPLTGLDLQTGASESSIDVSAPNPEVLANASLQVGAADFQARRLGNLNAEHLEVSAGVGQVRLDFSGDWRRDLDVDIGMGLGTLELDFPREIGVRLTRKSFLTSLDSEGLVKRGDGYYSPNWDEARVRIDVHVQAAFGTVKVVWLH